MVLDFFLLRPQASKRTADHPKEKDNAGKRSRGSGKNKQGSSIWYEKDEGNE